MSAGGSAAREAQTQLGFAGEFERLAVAARESARRFNAGAAGERRVHDALLPLEDLGYAILTDRRWPGSSRANVDMVVIGPGGVFVVDAKNWREVAVTGTGAEARISRGQDDVTDEIGRLADLADAIEGAFADLGIAPAAIHPIAVVTGRADLDARVLTVEVLDERRAYRRIALSPGLLSAGEVKRLRHAAELALPEHEDERPASVVVTAPPSRHLTAVPCPEEELISAAEVEEGLIAAHLAEPIEEWMTFLHPEQVKVVRRSYRGPSRIRGAAGTGKTVVGLHRAAYLARSRPGRVLVTTYVSTLPAVLRTLLGRLAPDVVDRVDFLGVHEVAKRVLAERGIRYRLDAAQAKQAWNAAWRTSTARQSLAGIDPTGEYWIEEVEKVIKGRGLTALEDYLACARTGRRRGLTAEQRTRVWTLFTDYSRELQRRGVWDFADVISAARACLTEPGATADTAAATNAAPAPAWASVVVDEAQDLTAAMVGMLHGVVGDAADGLTLIGDGQQSIYPGGYTLGELGISIAGRGVVMTRNYRNTVEIAEFAAELVRGDEFVDIEGETGRPDAAEIVRHGAAPALTRFASGTAHDQGFARDMRALVQSGVRRGDIGVLARTNKIAEDAASLLQRVGIPTVLLTEYDGTQRDAVKVGTLHRAKGLEFAHVALVRVPRTMLEPIPETFDGGVRERRDLDRRGLYVAMTRARDGLWVGVV